MRPACDGEARGRTQRLRLPAAGAPGRTPAAQLSLVRVCDGGGGCGGGAGAGTGAEGGGARGADGGVGQVHGEVQEGGGH